eukprot:6712447-Prymnesium_polylepis.3
MCMRLHKLALVRRKRLGILRSFGSGEVRLPAPASTLDDVPKNSSIAYQIHRDHIALKQRSWVANRVVLALKLLALHRLHVSLKLLLENVDVMSKLLRVVADALCKQIGSTADEFVSGNENGRKLEAIGIV